MIRAAIIGNPNVGKTVIFNRLTGLSQRVGNFPGVTVEKKAGRLIHKDQEIQVVDLPGTYSLTAHAVDELVARDYIVREKPDVIVDVVDGTNLERNLYLTLLLLEMDATLVVALNRWDMVSARETKINVEKLSELLGCPVVPTVAITGDGLENLKDSIVNVAGQRRKKSQRVSLNYGSDIEQLINRVGDVIRESPTLVEKYPWRWLAIRILEGDDRVMEQIRASLSSPQLTKILSIIKAREDTNKMTEHAEDLGLALAQRRYEQIASILERTVENDRDEALTLTDMLDQVLLNKYLGIPIFLTLLWTMFQFAFVVSEPFVVIIEKIFEMFGAWANQAVSDPHLASFVSSGILGGLGSVLVFIPPIFGLFLVLSILEDSGYMARAAFVMDRFMSKLGLHGRSFIPLMIGFGCNIPAIMAARSISNDKDRMVTMLIAPLISCSARLPVYVLIAGALYGADYAGTAVFAMYALGIVLAVAMAFIFRKTLFKGELSPFVLELPSYSVPNAESAVLHMWSRGKMFLKKAGTIIFGATIVIWLLAVHPWEATAGGQVIGESYLAGIGRAIEPLLKPFGWDWMTAVALLFGIIAKEVVIGTYGILLGAGDEQLGDALVSQGIFTPLTGFAFMAFVLIYVPCVASIATIAKETNSLRWPAFTFVYQTMLAFLIAGVIIAVGRLMGLS